MFCEIAMPSRSARRELRSGQGWTELNDLVFPALGIRRCRGDATPREKLPPIVNYLTNLRHAVC
jgi:hypothetical protein